MLIPAHAAFSHAPAVQEKEVKKRGATGVLKGALAVGPDDSDAPRPAVAALA